VLSIVYRYSKCSSIITVYSGDDELLYEIPSSSGVIKKYLGGKCPVCGKLLSTDIILSKIVIEVRRQLREPNIHRKSRGVEIEVRL
jgi:hypothetical protein